jgi:hypothetical protein
METVMSNEAVAVPNTVSGYADILMKLWAYRGVGREVLNPDESTTVSFLRCGNINFGLC